VDDGFDALAAFEELWRYIVCLMEGRRLPSWLKYSIGEKVISELTEVGSKLKMANYSHSDYTRHRLATEADSLYQKVKYELSLLLGGKRFDGQRGHVAELEAKFGGMLNRWINSKPSGDGR
jgi:hypothetical protein